MPSTTTDTLDTKMQQPILQSEIAIPISCGSCVASIQAAFTKLPNTITYEIFKEKQRVIVKHQPEVPLSQIVKVLHEGTGKVVIVRGLGVTKSLAGEETNPTSTVDSIHQDAAVCIFESFTGAKGWAQYNNRGVARLLQLPKYILVDISLSHLPPNSEWKLSVRESGDLREGVKSCGNVVKDLGVVRIDSKGRCNKITEVAGVELWEVIGTSMTLVRNDASNTNDSTESVCGIIARSSGIFENEKEVCACSGKSLWKEAVDDALLG